MDKAEPYNKKLRGHSENAVSVHIWGLSALIS
jgi:hypothetical protein